MLCGYDNADIKDLEKDNHYAGGGDSNSRATRATDLESAALPGWATPTCQVNFNHFKLTCLSLHSTTLIILNKLIEQKAVYCSFHIERTCFWLGTVTHYPLLMNLICNWSNDCTSSYIITVSVSCAPPLCIYP